MNIKEFEKQLLTPTKEMQDLWNSLNDYVFEIGVITPEAQRKGNDGVTNAELMYIHELGSHVQYTTKTKKGKSKNVNVNIPARPVLEKTIKWAQDNLIPKMLDRIMIGITEDDWGRSEIELELNKTAIRMQNYVRKHIRDNDLGLAPNAPSTIRGKGSDIPLLDTGQLSRSITCRVVRK